MSAPQTSYELSVRLLTGNGPQAIDKQTVELRGILASTPRHSAASREQLGK
ncbi:hypothetical protein ACIBM3_28225 [Rhodococcus erythropolis]|uniref:hypothetical protein n=1 Tax=Rhodococcus erythropolis TaxID=1833 RepID=UPI0037A63B82